MLLFSNFLRKCLSAIGFVIIWFFNYFIRWENYGRIHCTSKRWQFKITIHKPQLKQVLANVQNEYPTIAREEYRSTKTKYRSRLDAEEDMYIQLPTITPNVKRLSVSMQAHPPH